ncbi:LTA synthase family protein [Aneurinibacillus tyrosinisolvens]|uniref:LTA synthase family protein n=1 Tax=Aneurinibacillus tyrosinisolvens TaxID=1443435 RepID=UPI0006997A9A|nr:LTA synthase family protein [Aneurinibacillus tyrosinisolvens]
MPKKVTVLWVVTFVTIILKMLYVKYSIMGKINPEGFAAEVSFLFILISLFTWLKRQAVNISLLLLNLIMTVLSVTTVMYFNYYHAIFTYKSLHQLHQIGTVKDGILALFKPVYFLFFADFFLLAGLYKIKHVFTGLSINMNKKLTCIAAVLVVFFISLGIFNSTNTLSEINKYDQLGLVGYQFSAAAIGIKQRFKAEQVINAETIKQKQGDFITHRNRKLHGIAKNNNVIVVQLEAMQNFLINKKINGKEVTPHLNKLIKESYYFPNFYTQVGIGNTSDAEFITNTSIYPLGDIAMSSAIEKKNVPGLPRLLGKLGYHTATFHANNISFWNREKLYQALGFQEYFDDKYFGNEDVIAYGVSDEVMYKKTIAKLLEYNQKGEKFYSHIISLSSHFPYNLPDTKKRFTVGLPAAYDNSRVGSYIQAVSYADYAFGKFLAELKKDGMYDHSIIVVYGDHQGLQTENEKDVALVHELLGRKYDTLLDHLNVPLIVKIPTVTKGEIIQTVGGLVDIYPTIANLLGADISKEIVFGTDLMNANDHMIGIRFYAPTGSYINQSFGFTPGTTKSSGKIMNLKDRKVSPANNEALKLQERMVEYLKLSDEYVRALK